MSISAILLDAGHIVEIDTTGNGSVTQTWVSANVRPELTPQTLPALGDNYSTINSTISGQALITGTNGLYCKRISETSYFGDDHTVGTLYQVYYDSINDRVNVDPTDTDGEVVMSISSGTHTDTISFEYDTTLPNKLYKLIGSTWTEITNSTTITKITPTITVSTTKRYKSYTPIEIIALGTYAGCTNSATMWGFGAGCILYNGHSAQPLQEVVDDEVALTWNVTNNYSIRYVPGKSTDTWEYIFKDGEYVRLSTTPSTAGLITLYTQASIPDDIG